MRTRLHGGGSDEAVIFSRLLPTCVVRLGLGCGSPSAARLSSHAVGRRQLLGAFHPIRSNFVGCHVGPHTILHRVPKNRRWPPPLSGSSQAACRQTCKAFF
ncbi:hypothetical protein T05_2826 [Trichinella murrelli]|uniref:Uncharacterized protein n=1 Tax=Trichinella murrelli TaxID=144512 RepID=A0A0V0TAX3_9BILA|nr:hypothetical protein T05_2826 [Trichinella murrelli]